MCVTHTHTHTHAHTHTCVHTHTHTRAHTHTYTRIHTHIHTHTHTHIFCDFFFKFYLFICLFVFWLCWVLVSVRGLSLVAASGGHYSSRCGGLSLLRPLLLWSTSSRRAGSVVVAHGPSCSAACGILPDQGSNPCPLHWQADSPPLCHQGNPVTFLFFFLTAPRGMLGS